MHQTTKYTMYLSNDIYIYDFICMWSKGPRKSHVTANNVNSKSVLKWRCPNAGEPCRQVEPEDNVCGQSPRLPCSGAAMLQSWRGKGFGRNHLIKIPVLPWRLVSVHAYMVLIVMCDLYAYQATFLEAWLVLVLDVWSLE